MTPPPGVPAARDPRTGLPLLLQDAADIAALRDRYPLPYQYYSPWPVGLLTVPPFVLPTPPLVMRHAAAVEMESKLLLARLGMSAGMMASSPSFVVPPATLQTAARGRQSPPAVPGGPVVSSSSSAELHSSQREPENENSDQEVSTSSSSPQQRRKPTPDQAWEIMFKRLVKYRIRHGNCLVREKDDPKLGRWVRNQRNRKKQGRLTPDRIDRLDSIDFIWCMVHQESWDVMFQRLVDYKEKHGDCLVPRSYKNDPKLGRWVDTQRNKNKDDMSDERMKQLEDIGFVWQVHRQSWDTMFDRLVKYKEEHGDCLVPSVCREDPKLGTWVHVQRSRRTLLSEDRRQRLDSIGFVWCMFELKRKTSVSFES